MEPGLPRCRGDRNCCPGMPGEDEDDEDEEEPWWDKGWEFPGVWFKATPDPKGFPKELDGGSGIPGERPGLSAGPSLGSGSWDIPGSLGGGKKHKNNKKKKEKLGFSRGFGAVWSCCDDKNFLVGIDRKSVV